MKITFRSYGHIQLATAEGVKSYEHQAGETVTLPEDVATQFINSGVAIPAVAERTTKAKGETATK